MKMNKDRWISLCLILFALIWIWQASKIKPLLAVASEDVGPKLFPFFAGSILLVCSIGKFFSSKEKGKPFCTKEQWITVGILLGTLVAYMLLLYLVGFLVSTPPMLFALVYLLNGRKKPKVVKTIIFAVVMTAIVFLVFRYVLSVMLPMGILFD